MKQYIREEILPLVEKPARYLGNEWNSIHKSWDKGKVKMAFCFPDIYEIAMSHLGFKILYGLINKRENLIMERCFAPWIDMEQIMREKGIPLFSLESYKPLKDFDVIGFTLQYEMSYSNILNMLHMGQIPPERHKRGAEMPLVIAGGPCAYNPEPLADFIDCFLIGDGEELLPEFLEELARHKKKGWDKKRFLGEICFKEGVYVPEYYEFRFGEGGLLKDITPLKGVPQKVKKRVLTNFDKAYFPVEPIVPYIESVHDRVMLEITRGCTRGCRFCQAGIIYRPVREKNLDTICSQALESLKNTGYDEISLTSLSSADYSQIKEAVSRLLSEHGREGVGLALSSLRVDSFSVELAKEIQKIRKTGLTFAPEAGTQRLRDVINKGVTEENLADAVKGAAQAGWHQLKLYFMIGLPTETFEDIKGIAELVRMVLDIGKKGNFKKKFTVTVSVSSFVPKAHTPFQWEAQNDISQLKEKQAYLGSLLKGRNINYNYHDASLSLLEAVFARGDRRLCKVLKSAWEKGCKFDSWQDHFRYDLWLEAFKEHRLDPGFYATRKREYDELLPWDVIDTGITKEFLIEEHKKALEGKRTEDCRFGTCGDCGICYRFGVSPELAGCEAGEDA